MFVNFRTSIEGLWDSVCEGVQALSLLGRESFLIVSREVALV